MKFNEDLAWNIILVVSIFLILNGMADIGDKDKKAAQVAQNEAAIGAGGAIAFMFKKQVAALAIPGFVWLWGTIVGVGLVAPGIFGNIINIFRPSPSIPSWIWIGAFIVIIFMLMSKKK